MFHIPTTTSNKLALGIALAGVLAAPAAAHAATPASVSAAAKAGVQAEVHLHRAADLAAKTDRAAQRRTRALMARSRGELKRAVGITRALAASADTPAEANVAGRLATTVTGGLSTDMTLQSRITVAAGGPVETIAATSLVNDVKMQKALLDEVLAAAARAGAERAQVAIDAGGEAVTALSQEVEAAARAAAADLGARAQASADLAVALGTDALRTTAATAARIDDQATHGTDAAAQRVRDVLSDAAGRIATLVAATRIEAHPVTVGGDATTLGDLADLNLRATVSLLATTGGDAAGDVPTGPAAGGMLSGLLGVRR